jgi:hypothetical protein
VPTKIRQETVLLNPRKETLWLKKCKKRKIPRILLAKVPAVQADHKNQAKKILDQNLHPKKAMAAKKDKRQLTPGYRTIFKQTIGLSFPRKRESSRGAI